MKKLLRLLSLIVVLIYFAGCNTTDDYAIEPGSICTIRDGEGKFQVAKVLVINEKETHLMIFKQTYDTRPASIGPSDLTLSDLGDSVNEQEGVPHVGMSREEFEERAPVVVAFEPVVEEDLKGYETWKNQQP